MRLIDADALDQEMYHKSFEVDDGRNVWNSGLWIRYKIFEEAIRDAPTVDVEPKWIPCSERLPDDDRTKVVTLANGNAEAGYYSNGDWWCVGDSINLENPTVIAWTPLPMPYGVDK
jgi:hypothetical protein